MPITIVTSSSAESRHRTARVSRLMGSSSLVLAGVVLSRHCTPRDIIAPRFTSARVIRGILMGRPRLPKLVFLFTIPLFFFAGLATAAEVEIIPDVVYGHKDGLAMTMDVIKPKTNANGAAV